MVYNTSTSDIIRCIMLLFESLNKPLHRVSPYFHSMLCQPAPTATAHPHHNCMVSCKFFAPASLGNKPSQTHRELSSFMTLKSLPHFNCQEFSPAGFHGSALLFGQYSPQRAQERRSRKMRAVPSQTCSQDKGSYCVTFLP